MLRKKKLELYVFINCKRELIRFQLCRQRMDLGECPKIHDLALRADFEKAQASKDYFYDLDVTFPIKKTRVLPDHYCGLTRF